MTGTNYKMSPLISPVGGGQVYRASQKGGFFFALMIMVCSVAH